VIGNNSGWESKRMEKLNELWDELKLVFSGRGAGIFDALIPLLAYIIGSRFMALNTAVIVSLAAAGGLILLRILRKEPLTYAAGGAATTLLAALLSYIGGTEGGFYLPGLISGGLTVLACLVSVVLKQPIAAYSSMITRGWPKEWYLHPRVRPAYSEVTLMWAALFAIRLAVELVLFLQNNVSALGTVRVVMGWPYTILVLVISYLYGLKRLRDLEGPSVEEFESGAEPPWHGQKKGF
jgi:hypothetical protein